jgi:pectate lyase
MRRLCFLVLFFFSTSLAACVSESAFSDEASMRATAAPLIASANQGQKERCSRCDPGRDVLGPNDGWASLGAGTTGGSLAVPGQVYVVSNRAEFIAALNNGTFSPTSPSNPSNEPKTIYVDGTIDFNVDDANQPLACADYYRDGHSQETFLTTYDPAVWGRIAPSGAGETARLASQQAQQARVRVRIGSNTTIAGVGSEARLRGVWLDIRGSSTVNVSNIIVRNLTFQDTFDCFPAWAPTDGAQGAWNSLYDSISLRNADHVWIDHNTFEDRETADENQASYFGVLFQMHDGELDITNASDLVTVSFNRFRDHDKVMLIGSSDGAIATDRGKLRVTLHHNLFRDVGQRAPRVRFGQVHVYNNYYKIENAPAYGYSWGVGFESAIYAENNFFETDKTLTRDRLIERLNGTAIFESGTEIDGRCEKEGALVLAWNAVNDPDLSDAVGWAPSLFSELQATKRVPVSVKNGAGPFAW